MEQNIIDLIEQHEAEVSALEVARNRAYWEFSTDANRANEERLEATELALKTLFSNRERYARIRAYDSDYRSEVRSTRRQIHLIRLDFLEHQIAEATGVRLIEQEAHARHIMTGYRANVDGEALSASDVVEVFATSEDTKRRRAVWYASRGVGNEAAPAILRLANLRNRHAREMGYRDFYELSMDLQQIDETTLLRVIDEIVECTETAFRREKVALDKELGKHFGCAVKKLRPWHYADPFFQTAPRGRAVDLDRYYEGADLVKATRDFFNGLGINVNDIIKRSDLSPREGKDQHAFCLHLDRQSNDVRVLSNNAPTAAWMSTMLREFGHAAYRRNLADDLPFALRRPAHALAAEAVANLMSRQAVEPSFLTGIVGANRSSVTKATRGLRSYQRLRMLILARWVAVMTYFERELYHDPGRDMSRIWWDLVQRFQLLRRPEDLKGTEWASKVHLATDPVSYHNHLLCELMASQLTGAIELETGSADLVGNKAGGTWLVEKVFRPGALFHWNDLLKRITGEELSAKSFLSQFVEE